MLINAKDPWHWTYFRKLEEKTLASSVDILNLFLCVSLGKMLVLQMCNWLEPMVAWRVARWSGLVNQETEITCVYGWCCNFKTPSATNQNKEIWKQIQNPVEKTLPSEDNKKRMHWEWVFPCWMETKWQREESGIISLFWLIESHKNQVTNHLVKNQVSLNSHSRNLNKPTNTLSSEESRFLFLLTWGILTKPAYTSSREESTLALFWLMESLQTSFHII